MQCDWTKPCIYNYIQIYRWVEAVHLQTVRDIKLPLPSHRSTSSQLQESRKWWCRLLSTTCHIPSISPWRPLSPHELAQESVALASRGQRLSAESIEWLVPRGGYDVRKLRIIKLWKLESWHLRAKISKEAVGEQFGFVFSDWVMWDIQNQRRTLWFLKEEYSWPEVIDTSGRNRKGNVPRRIQVCDTLTCLLYVLYVLIQVYSQSFWLVGNASLSFPAASSCWLRWPLHRCNEFQAKSPEVILQMMMVSLSYLFRTMWMICFLQPYQYHHLSSSTVDGQNPQVCW